MSPHDPDEMFPTPRLVAGRSRIVMNKTGKGVLGLLIVLALAHGIMSAIEGRRLEAKIEALKASGQAVSYAELEKMRVPGAENAAPIYKKAFAKLPKKGSKADALDDLLDPQKRENNPKLWADAAKTVAKYGAVIPLIEQAAAKPRCRYPVNWGDGIHAGLPHLHNVKRLGRLLGARALLQARNGDMAGAFHSVELGFSVGESLADEPPVISQLIRIAVLRTQSQALRRIATEGPISEIQARRIYDLFGGADLTPGFIKAIQMEKLCGIWLYDYTRNDPRELAELSSSGSWGERKHSRAWKSLGFLWRPVSYADEIVYLDYMNKIDARAGMPYREIKPKLTPADYDPRFPWYAIVARITAPVFADIPAQRDNGTAELSGSQILMALTAYKNRNGTYPASLAELRSKLGWKIPSDPFSGKDFIYRRQGSGFLLYSIGQNLKDDGARVFTRGNTPEGYAYRDENGQWVADIIWRMNR